MIISSCTGDWNGAGGHVNFSNNDSRKEGTGWDAIKKQIGKLEKKHALHIASYGEGNERRLTGESLATQCLFANAHMVYVNGVLMELTKDILLRLYHNMQPILLQRTYIHILLFISVKRNSVKLDLPCDLLQLLCESDQGVACVV